MDLALIREHLLPGYYLLYNDKLIEPLTFGTLYKAINSFVRSRFKRTPKMLKVKSNNNNNNKVKGSILQYRISDKQLLVINFDEGLVYRKYNNLEQLERVLTGQDSLVDFFNINPVEFLNPDTTKEQLVEGKPLSQWSHQKQNFIFNEIIKKYSRTANRARFSISSSKISLERFLEGIQENLYPEEMKEYLYLKREKVEKILDSIPWTWAHSDLTPHNIIVSEESYFIIDSERCEVKPLFYDIINLMTTFSLMSNNNTQITEFFEGRYDHYFQIFLKDEQNHYEFRLILYLIMVNLKLIKSWDAETKRKDGHLLERRWLVIKPFFDKEYLSNKKKCLNVD